MTASAPLYDYAIGIHRELSAEDATPMWYCGACGSGRSERPKAGRCPCRDARKLVQLRPGMSLENVRRALVGPQLCAVTGKTIFHSPDAADVTRRSIRRRSDERMRVYRCEHCRFWHLGHADKVDRKVQGGER